VNTIYQSGIANYKMSVTRCMDYSYVYCFGYSTDICADTCLSVWWI